MDPYPPPGESFFGLGRRRVKTGACGMVLTPGEKAYVDLIAKL